MASRVDDVVSLTERLVKIDSYARDVGETESYEEVNGEVMGEVLDVAEDYFSSIDNLSVKRFTQDGRESLVATFGSVKEVDLMLHGHLDVVRPDEDNFIGEDAEDHFEPVTDTVNGEERIYGRGTGDMKAGAACLMRVMKELSENPPSIGLMLTTDEEKGGFRGTKYLLDEEGYSADFAISAEPNNIGEGYLDIVNKQKGILRAYITAEGESAHASRKWKGENAIDKLISMYGNEIKPLFPSADERTWDTTANLGMVEGGDGLNKVPDKASLGLDIRWSDEKPIEEVKEEIRKKVSSRDDLSVEFRVEEPMLNTSDSDLVERLQSDLEETIDEDKSARITKKAPGSDARHFMRQDIPAVVFGPEGYNSHQKDEYSVVDSFEDYVKSVKKFAQRF